MKLCFIAIMILTFIGLSLIAFHVIVNSSVVIGIKKGVYAIYVPCGVSSSPGLVFYAKYRDILSKSELSRICSITASQSIYETVLAYQDCIHDLYRKGIRSLYVFSWYVYDEDSKFFYVIMRLDLFFAKFTRRLCDIKVRDVAAHIVIEEKVAISKVDRGMYYNGRRVGLWPFFLLPHELYEGNKVKVVERHPLRDLFVDKLTRSRIEGIFAKALEKYGLKFDTCLSISKYYEATAESSTSPGPGLIPLNISVDKFVNLLKSLVAEMASRYDKRLAKLYMNMHIESSGDIIGVSIDFDARTGIAISLSSPTICPDPFIEVIPLQDIGFCPCNFWLLARYGKGYHSYILDLEKVFKSLGIEVKLFEEVGSRTKPSEVLTSKSMIKSSITAIIKPSTLLSSTQSFTAKHSITVSSVVKISTSRTSSSVITSTRLPTQSIPLMKSTTTEPLRTSAKRTTIISSHTSSYIVESISTVSNVVSKHVLKSTSSRLSSVCTSSSVLTSVKSTRHEVIPKDIQVLIVGMIVALLIVTTYIVFKRVRT